jgi:hypothetical protein
MKPLEIWLRAHDREPVLMGFSYAIATISIAADWYVTGSPLGTSVYTLLSVPGLAIWSWAMYRTWGSASADKFDRA